MHTSISDGMANKIYDLLVQRAEASEHWRGDFVSHMTGTTREYRFQGCLGFGGKFYNDHRWRIECYAEDDTPDRRAIITEVNALLSEWEKSAG
jgi:hypothetical protein